MVKKDALIVLNWFKESKVWLDYVELLEKETEEMKLSLHKELLDMTEMSIHTLWRQMAIYIQWVEVKAKDAFGTTEWWDIICDQIGIDIKTRYNNIYKAVAEDFNKNQSAHDVIRSMINYLEWVVTYPEKLIEIEEKEQENEKINAEVAELEATQQAELD